jgi:hypothetical protein
MAVIVRLLLPVSLVPAFTGTFSCSCLFPGTFSCTFLLQQQLLESEQPRKQGERTVRGMSKTANTFKRSVPANRVSQSHSSKE